MGHVTRATRSGSGAAPRLVRQQRTRIYLVAIRVRGEARELVGNSERTEPGRRLGTRDDAATRAGGLCRGLTERRRVPCSRPRNEVIGDATLVRRVGVGVADEQPDRLGLEDLGLAVGP